MIKKLKIWVTGRSLEKNLIYNVNHNQWFGTMNFINQKYPSWEMIIIYDKKTNQEMKRYYNYNNKKTFPINKNEI